MNAFLKVSFFRLVAATVCCAPASFGQYVISARPGLIHYVEGRVYLDGAPLAYKLGAYPEMKRAGELRTEDGYAEVLLNPGVFLHLGENSTVRLVSNRLSDIRIDLVSGAAIVAPSGLVAPAEVRMDSVSVTFQNTAVRLLESGVYRFAAAPPQLLVRAGQAEVTYCGKSTFVGADKGIALDRPGQPESFDPAVADSLDRWSRHRADTVSTATLDAARRRKEAARSGSVVWPRNLAFPRCR